VAAVRLLADRGGLTERLSTALTRRPFSTGCMTALECWSTSRNADGGGEAIAEIAILRALTAGARPDGVTADGVVTAALAPWLKFYNTGRRQSALGGHPNQPTVMNVPAERIQTPPTLRPRPHRRAT
jgi:hypothetical protein